MRIVKRESLDNPTDILLYDIRELLQVLVNPQVDSKPSPYVDININRDIKETASKSKKKE